MYKTLRDTTFDYNSFKTFLIKNLTDMKLNVLNLEGVTLLSRENQKNIKGRIKVNGSPFCDCDCDGNVIGRPECEHIIACLELSNCEEVD